MYDRCTFDRRYPQDQIYNKRKLVPTWGTFGDIYTNSVSRMSILFVFFSVVFLVLFQFRSQGYLY